MQATIDAEFGDTVALTVTDAADETHEFELKRDGTLEQHSLRGTSVNVSERSGRAAEQIRQVRRFARYHLYRRRGDDALSPYDGEDWIAYPERIAAVALTIGLGTSKPDCGREAQIEK